jgi:probable F420-dependent oxidoreductase
MKIGCHLPMFGPIGTRESLLTFARRMEELGYDSLWASDHVAIPYRIASRYPYSPTGQFPLAADVPFLEPLTTLSLVAAVTERVQLGTSILVLSHRNPVLAAKMCATLDHLSGGRLVLGVGVGWMREEIALLEGHYDRRGDWSDEAMAVMRACWRDARTAHRGQFFSFEEIGVFPKPTRGDIPILIGGHTPRALRRVVHHGDGWHAAFITPEALAADITRLRAECARQRRPYERLTISVRAGLSLRSAPLGPDRKPLQGSRDQVIADLVAFRDLGVDSMLLEARYRDLPDMLSIYDTFAREIRPRI